MGEKTLEMVDDYVNQLAESLGVAAEYVMEVLVRQQIVSGSVWITFAVVCLAVATVIGVIVYKTLKYAEVDKGLFDRGVNNYGKLLTFGDYIGFVFFVAIGCVLAGVGLVTLFTNIPIIINPEYYAIKEILDVVKGGS